MNHQGLPVPYVAAGPDNLGDTDPDRIGEVLLRDLCQVCGLSIEWPAVIVIRVNDPEWWPDGQELDGLIHQQECAPLAFSHCPYLVKQQGFEVFRVGRDDVGVVDGRLTVLADRENLRVPFEDLLR